MDSRGARAGLAAWVVKGRMVAMAMTNSRQARVERVAREALAGSAEKVATVVRPTTSMSLSKPAALIHQLSKRRIRDWAPTGAWADPAGRVDPAVTLAAEAVRLQAEILSARAPEDPEEEMVLWDVST